MARHSTLKESHSMDTPSITPSTPSRPTSSLALVSLVSGILAWILLPIVGAIVAIITGHMARRELRAEAGRLSGDGMATAGLILGYAQVVLILLPACCILVLVLVSPGVGEVFSQLMS
jgi:hypothetical protein